MKNKIATLLILVIVFGFLPKEILAISENQIKSQVKIICTDGKNNWFSGSGTIIDSSGIILTNKHVVEGAYKNVCFIGFLDSINKEPNFGNKGNYNLAEVKFKSQSKDLDIAILYFNNKNNIKLSSIDIWNSNSDNLKFGDKIEVIGFPGIGGSTITYSSGDFSGFGSKMDNTYNYIKATTPIEHGNSGGAAYNSKGQFIGIPTMVITGSLNSLSYILSINSIKKWLNDSLGLKFKSIIIGESSKVEDKSININENSETIDIKKIKVNFYDCSKFYTGKDVLGNLIAPEKDDYYFGDNNQGTKFFVPNDDYRFPNTSNQINPIEECKLIKNNIKEVQKINFETVHVVVSFPKDITDKLYDYSIQISREPLLHQTLQKKSFFGENERLWYINLARSGQLFIRPSIGGEKGNYYLAIKLFDKFGNETEMGLWQYKYGYDEVVDTEFIDKNFSEKMKGKILLQIEEHGEAWYVNPRNGKRHYMANGKDAFNIMRNLGTGISNKSIKTILLSKTQAKKYSGRILLQVEDKGQAFYVDFQGNAHYLKDGNSAFAIMKKLGIGISNKDLRKIDIQ